MILFLGTDRLLRPRGEGGAVVFQKKFVFQNWTPQNIFI